MSVAGSPKRLSYGGLPDEHIELDHQRLYFFNHQVKIGIIGDKGVWHERFAEEGERQRQEESALEVGFLTLGRVIAYKLVCQAG